MLRTLTFAFALLIGSATFQSALACESIHTYGSLVTGVAPFAGIIIAFVIVVVIIGKMRDNMSMDGIATVLYTALAFFLLGVMSIPLWPLWL